VSDGARRVFCEDGIESLDGRTEFERVQKRDCAIEIPFDIRRAAGFEMDLSQLLRGCAAGLVLMVACLGRRKKWGQEGSRQDSQHDDPLSGTSWCL
jgi:hypothetical protein